MSDSEMEARIATEAADIRNAPQVPVQTGRVGRCSFCGRTAQNLEPVDTFHGLERYRGDCCIPRYSGE
jgi:hypothetical protein